MEMGEIMTSILKYFLLIFRFGFCKKEIEEIEKILTENL